jgi:hypothetical protein
MLKKLMNMDKQLLTNYLLVWGLVAVSGFPFFYSTQAFIMLLLVITFFIFLKRSYQFDFRFFAIYGAFLLVEALQVFVVKPFEPQIMAGTFMRMFLAFLVVDICKKKFVNYYVDIMYVLIIISFIFFFPSYFFPSFNNFFINNICPFFTAPGERIEFYSRPQPTIIIFAFDSAIPEFRNAGPFWEQGAFAIFILFGMIFNLTIEKSLWTKRSLVFSLGLLTTLSTSGYIAFFILVGSYYVINESFFRRMIFIMISVPLAFVLYFNLEFLNAKIENNIAIAAEDNTSRFGSGLSDLKDWAKSPYVGWGRGSMRYGGRKFAFFTVEQHRNNGLSGFLCTYGIFMFIFFFYMYYKSIRAACIESSLNTSFALFGLIVVLLCGFSQTIFQYPFFFAFLYVHLPYKFN